MDSVILTRAQLKRLAAKNIDYVVIGQHMELKMILVEPLADRGNEHKRVWLKENGVPRDEGVKL